MSGARAECRDELGELELKGPRRFSSGARPDVSVCLSSATFGSNPIPNGPRVAGL